MAEQFRRTDPRYERQLDIEIVLGGERQTGIARNISLGGMYVETASAPPAGVTVQLRFQVPTQPEPIEVMGDIRWVDAKGPGGKSGMGIRFHGLRARDVWALNRFFQT